MKVNVLQQFLRNLILPLEASAANTATITALQRACQGFEPFQDKEVAEFAEFLMRAAAYERDGKWPPVNPPISGPIVDEPNAHEYSQRLRTFLEREAPANEPIPDHVRAELHRLAKRLKSTQLKEMARELQIEESFRGAKQAIEKIVLKLTGQSLRGKKPRSARRTAAADPAEIQRYADELKELSGGDGLETRVRELVETLSGPKLHALAQTLGATRKARRKPAWSEILLAALRQPTGQSKEPASNHGKVERLAEIIAALKSKADGPDAPADEIEAELRSLDQQMDEDDALAVAKHIGIGRHVHSRSEAIEEIRRKVFETKRSPERVAH